MANLITLGRIALIVPFILFFMTNAAWGVKAAFVVFVIAALTDFADGFVARARNETSDLGAALDPIADKLLVTAALILLMRNGIILGSAVLAALIIILREIAISGLREAIAARGDMLPVTGLAKWKTTAQLIAAGALLLAAPTGFVGLRLAPLAIGLLWVAAVLTFWTGADYALRAAQLLRRG